MKIACAHSYSKPLDIEDNIKRIEGFLRIFDEERVEYALFPELSVSGYFNDKDELCKYSVYQSDILNSLRHLSHRYNVVFAVGLPMMENDKWYIAQVVFQYGQIIGKHYKTHLSESEARTFSKGEQLNQIPFSSCITGFQICLETHVPELSSIHQQRGAQILSMPFASPRETPNDKLKRLGLMIQARAYDNACYVMACNLTGFTPSGKSYAGFSIIINPRGEVIASQMGYEPGYCMATIDLNEIDRIKQSRMGYFPGMKRMEWLTGLYKSFD